MNDWAIALLGGAVGSVVGVLVSEMLHRRRDGRRALEVVRSEFGHQQSVLEIWLENVAAEAGAERTGPIFPDLRVLETLAGDLGNLPREVQDRARSLVLFLRELRKHSEKADEHGQALEAGLLMPDASARAHTALHDRLVNVRIAVEQSGELLTLVDAELARNGVKALRNPV